MNEGTAFEYSPALLFRHAVWVIKCAQHYELSIAEISSNYYVLSAPCLVFVYIRICSVYSIFLLQFAMPSSKSLIDLTLIYR